MSDDPHDAEAPSAAQKSGEGVVSSLTMGWVRDGIEVPSGTMIGQHRMLSTAAKDYAALHLILEDLKFAVDCFLEADKLGTPSTESTLSKALTYSGTMAYARCFKAGVRPVKLSSEILKESCQAYDVSAHDYLLALRDKHIAHSVNSFERCDTFAVVFKGPGEAWREGHGVGVVTQLSIGLTRTMLQAALEHVRRVHAWVTDEIKSRRKPLYEEFKGQWNDGDLVQMVPLVTLEDRAAVATRRK